MISKSKTKFRYYKHFNKPINTFENNSHKWKLVLQKELLVFVIWLKVNVKLFLGI